MDSGSREQNYWPGFVDALSNVVLTLVFVLVVFVFALVVTSSKVTQKATEFVEQRRQNEMVIKEQVVELKGDLAAETIDVGELAMVKESLQQKLAAARAEAQATKSEIAKTQKALDSLKQNVEDQERATTPSIITEKVELAVDAKAERMKTGEGEVDAISNAIVITYPRGVYIMNEKAKAELVKVLSRYRTTIADAKATLTASMGPETYSEARRMAYYRALDVRNFLLDQKLSGRQGVTITTKQGKGNDDGRVELRFVRP